MTLTVGPMPVPDLHARRATTNAHRRLTTPTVTVVIPTMNEARNLPHVLGSLPGGIDEIIIVDGNSTDGTCDVARRLCPHATIIQQRGRGKGNALADGFEIATGDIIVMIDADGSTAPEEIPRFVDALVSGADFAKGSRFLEGGGSTDLTALRGLGNRALVALVNLLYRTDYTDLCYGYNAFWRHCLTHLRIDCDGFEVETLMNIRVARAGLSVSEVPSFELDRIHGVSNLNATRDGWRVLRTIAREFRSAKQGASPRPVRLAVASPGAEDDTAA